MPKRLCQVTVTDSSGLSHTEEILASSRNQAACLYWARIRATPSLPQIKFEDDTSYEVKPAGAGTVYRITHRAMLTWANREAEKSATKTRR